MNQVISGNVYNNKPVLNSTGWMTKRDSYAYPGILGTGNLTAQLPAIVHAQDYLLNYYYDIELMSEYILTPGDVLYNPTDRIASTILRVDYISDYYPLLMYRFFTARDIGSNFNQYTCRVVSVSDIQRVIDYKLQADSKNYYYFSDNNEWVVYHTFDEESYYGNRFYPTLGSVSCYDEDDSEIHPTDILFYPECISNGIFEGAKTIVKWASNQSGKVCFNPGFSNQEARDQSRLILPVSRHNWNGLECNVTIPTDFRATAINIIEPFMTVDALDNGNIVEHALVYHSVPNLTDTRMSQALHYGNVKIKADKRFFNALNDKIESKSVNTDILNVITLGANNQWELVDVVNNIYSFMEIQGSNHASFSGSKVFLNAMNITPSTPGYENFDLDMYQDGYIINGIQYRHMIVDNIGWVYDPDAPYKYQLKFYVHSSYDPNMSYFYAPTNMFTGGSIDLYDKIISIDKYEPLRPLVKVDGVDGYLKIVSKSKSNPVTQVTDGKFEAEYVLEFPCAPGSTFIRGITGGSAVGMENQFVFHSDFIPRQKTAQDTLDDQFYYRNCQIFFPQSFVRAGGFTKEFNERLSYNMEQSFTSTVLAENGFQTYAYRRNAGGYEQSADKTIIGKTPIKYPTNVVYRNIIPNKLESRSDSFFIEILANDFKDMRLFVLYRNDKWKYDRSKFESISGRENPAYIFEIDSNALINDYSEHFKTMPTLPDVKRWFDAYCRGFAYMNNNSYTDRILPSESTSELVLDIWDNMSAIGTKYDGVVNVVLEGGQLKIKWVSGDKFLERRFLENNIVQVMDSSGVYQDFIIASFVDDETIITSGTTQIQYGKYKYETHSSYSFYQDIVYEGGNWRSITPSANDSVAVTNAQYINDYKTFKFGGETVVGATAKIKKYFDLRSKFGPFQATEFTEIAQADGSIVSASDIIPLTLQGFTSGYGSTGTQCKFNGHTSYLLNDTSVSDLDKYSMCYVIEKGFVSEAPDNVAGVQFTIPAPSLSNASFEIGIGYNGGNFRIRTVFFDGTMTVNETIAASYDAYDKDMYVMIVKNGSTYTITASAGYNNPISLTVNLPSVRTSHSALKINNLYYIGTFNPWSMNKFYMFNRELSFSECLSFIRDGSGQDFTGADRYIDENKKMYFRARVARGRQFNVRKNSSIYDVFANGKPPSWSTGAIDPSAVVRTENISTFGLDYFRVESL